MMPPRYHSLNLSDDYRYVEMMAYDAFHYPCLRLCCEQSKYKKPSPSHLALLGLFIHPVFLLPLLFKRLVSLRSFILLPLKSFFIVSKFKQNSLLIENHTRCVPTFSL
jgi:hypothetical protein